MSVAELLRRHFPAMTASEQRIARVILGDYPRAGLESAARLARRAGSSAPTVVRFAVKLGFSGYPDLQEALRSELGERSHSPLDRLRVVEGQAAAVGSVLPRAVEQTLAGVARVDLEAAAGALELLHDRVCIGGRYSTILAQYLSWHLQLMLPRVRHVPLGPLERISALLDISVRSAVVAFDLRRYQDDTVTFCREAKSQGAHLTLFTDQWLSPAADYADILFVCAVDSDSLFDSITAPMAVTECLIATMAAHCGNQAKERLNRFEGHQRP